MGENTISNEIYFGHLYETLINAQIDSGLDELTAVSGFASGAFLRHLLMEHSNLSLRLIIGMASVAGISSSDHKIYKDLITNYPDRFNCSYYNGEYGVHVKAYAWATGGSPRIGLLGSPNLSWSGLSRHIEALVLVDPSQIIDIYEKLEESSLPVHFPDIHENITIFTPTQKSASRVSVSHGATIPHEVEEFESVTLSLLTAGGEIHQVSGLNWGQRGGREPNQMYIPIHAAAIRGHEDFFPPRRQRFTIETDDGHSFVCSIAQAGDKAIHTPDNNSLLGLYFRNRIGVPSGEFVTKKDLENYGRTDVEITKIDDDLFLMDFSTS